MKSHCGNIDPMGRVEEMIIAAAKRAARIENPELRELAAYALDEVHAWRCSTFVESDECEAIADAFVEDGETKVAKVLQPLALWRSWYITGPIHGWISELREWDDEKNDSHWQWNRKFLQPWRHAPRLRDEFKWVARFAARRTWYSADSFIADYVAEVAPRLIDGMGTPAFFFTGTGSHNLHYHPSPDDEVDTDLARACYEYSLTVLAEMARLAVDPDFSDMDEIESDFADALAEAMKIGMLWD